MSRTPKAARRAINDINHPTWKPPYCHGPSTDPVLRDVDRWYCRRLPAGPCEEHVRISRMHAAYASRRRTRPGTQT